jgi:hypothetical protein
LTERFSTTFTAYFTHAEQVGQRNKTLSRFDSCYYLIRNASFGEFEQTKACGEIGGLGEWLNSNLKVTATASDPSSAAFGRYFEVALLTLKPLYDGGREHLGGVGAFLLLLFWVG